MELPEKLELKPDPPANQAIYGIYPNGCYAWICSMHTETALEFFKRYTSYPVLLQSNEELTKACKMAKEHFDVNGKVYSMLKQAIANAGKVGI